MKISLSGPVSRREILAITIAAILLLTGFWLGITTEAAWLSRMGTLVIICGIVFAATDLPRALESRARARAKVVIALLSQNVVPHQEALGECSATQSERAQAQRYQETFEKQFVEEQAAQPRVRFLLLEATIICIGTFLNGFGELIARVLASG